MLRKKELERILELVPPFPKPKERLEQYQTDARLAAELIWFALLRSELQGIVADFGVGTGRLAFACALTEAASYIIGLDVDRDALSTALRFFDVQGLRHLVEFVEADATKPPLRKVNIVIQNPPFGMRSKRGIDLEFLKAALSVSNVVYSIHAYSDGLLSAIKRKLGVEPEIVFETNLLIPQIYAHHRRRVHRVRVVVVRVSKLD